MTKANRGSNRIQKLTSALAGILGLSLWLALLYALSIAGGMEKPSFVPSAAHNAVATIALLAGAIALLGYTGWLIWRVSLAFRSYPGWCSAAAVVWTAIYFGYTHSEFTRDKVGLTVFVFAGGLAFIFLASKMIRSVEDKAKREGADEEHQRSAMAGSLNLAREIPLGYRPEDLP